jgi:hypothetical protein
MAWTAVSWSYKDAITYDKLQQMQDNITALATGAAGAPEIETAALKDGCVTSDKLAADILTQILVNAIIFS